MNERTLRFLVSQVGFFHQDCGTLVSADAQGPLYLLISMSTEDSGLLQKELGLHLGLWLTPWFPPGPRPKLGPWGWVDSHVKDVSQGQEVSLEKEE